jgi:hypothetical protein
MEDIPIINVLPEKYRGTALLIILAFPYVTRAYYAIVNGGGIIGAGRAILWGSNVPKDTKTQTP